MKKVSEINLSGLSPQSIEDGKRPNPALETVGYKKAKSILDMAMNKTAAPRHSGSPGILPQIERLLREREGDDSDEIDRAKRVGGYTLAGAGAGSFLGKTVNLGRNVFNIRPPASGASKLELASTLGGGLLGAIEAARQSAKKRNKKVDQPQKPVAVKTSSVSSDQLRAERETGKHSVHTGESVGRTLQQQARDRYIGRKFLRKEKVSAMHDDGEDLYRLKSTYLTREDLKAISDSLFGDVAVESRRKNREQMAKLLIQAPHAQTMAPSLQKESSSSPSFISEPSVPYKVKRKEYLAYLKSKAQETPPDVAESALLTGGAGAAIGGAIGLASGLSKGSPASGLGSGAAAGAIIGALLGTVSSLVESGHIEKAKHVLRTNGVDKSLAEEIAHSIQREKSLNRAIARSDSAREESIKERRHMQLIDAITKKASIYDVAPSTSFFFQESSKALGLTEAQSRYPELLTVKTAAGRSAGVPVHGAVGAKKASFPGSGPTPMQSQGSGGSA